MMESSDVWRSGLGTLRWMTNGEYHFVMKDEDINPGDKFMYSHRGGCPCAVGDLEVDFRRDCSVGSRFVVHQLHECSENAWEDENLGEDGPEVFVVEDLIGEDDEQTDSAVFDTLAAAIGHAEALHRLRR